MKYFIIIFILLLSSTFAQDTQWGQWNPIRWDALEPEVHDSIRQIVSDSLGNVAYATDTTAMKTSTSNVNWMMLKQLSSANPNGGGLFTEVDSAYAENASTSGYVKARATAGKQWVRSDWLQNRKVYASWYSTFDNLAGSGCNIVVDDSIALSANTSVADSITIEKIGDGVIDPNGKTLTIYGNINVGNKRIFAHYDADSSDVVYIYGGNTLNPVWFGAYRDKTNPTRTTKAFQNMFNSIISSSTVSTVEQTMQGRVEIPFGIYAINDSIKIRHSWTIEGQGNAAMAYNPSYWSTIIPKGASVLVAVDSNVVILYKYNETSYSYEEYSLDVSNIIFYDSTQAANGAIEINGGQHTFINHCQFWYFANGHSIRSTAGTTGDLSIYGHIYNNVFRRFRYAITHHSGSWKIENNRFINLSQDSSSVAGKQAWGMSLGGAGNSVYNNIWDIYDTWDDSTWAIKINAQGARVIGEYFDTFNSGNCLKVTGKIHSQPASFHHNYLPPLPQHGYTSRSDPAQIHRRQSPG